MGVPTREAVSIDRLNDTASAELQPFTAGLNLSKSQEKTNSADSQGCVCSCPPRWGRNSCYTGFQRSRDFPPVAKPINCHVSQNTLPCQPPTLPIVKTNSDWTPQQVMALQQLFSWSQWSLLPVWWHLWDSDWIGTHCPKLGATKSKM